MGVPSWDSLGTCTFNLLSYAACCFRFLLFWARVLGRGSDSKSNSNSNSKPVELKRFGSTVCAYKRALHLRFLMLEDVFHKISIARAFGEYSSRLNTALRVESVPNDFRGATQFSGARSSRPEAR